MRVLVRTTVIAALFALFFVAVEAMATDDAVGADIGVGLLAFALVFLGAGVWGLVDGLRLPGAATVVLWVIVGLMIGVLVPLFTALMEFGFSWDTLEWRVAVPEVFLALLVAVPALVGVGLGVAIRSARQPT